ncbi:MAG: EcoRV family type II restriction endonuclease [Phycisphaerales bacterium]|nr:EcoRV family type II restriction endonuclease [Phycisphaerales bacterium]
MKNEFEKSLKEFAETLQEHVSDTDGQWSIKGFIDVFKNVYTISSDTKVVSKILEIHLFPKILKFAEDIGYKIVLADHQNYYPDLSFVKVDNENIKFAVDLKTTYKNNGISESCNGFTLGSFGRYFSDRSCTTFIQYPYNEYSGHFCLGIIYQRAEDSRLDETKTRPINELTSITSVLHDFKFFVAEKWQISSDQKGSGNTANIGSVKNIHDLCNGLGMFSKLGEEWFDDYWMNYDKIIVTNKDGSTDTIKNLLQFVEYRGGDISLIVEKTSANKKSEN